MKRIVEIKATELAALRRKAQAHDDYLAAILDVEKRHATIAFKARAGAASPDYLAGYAAAITDLGQAVADVVAARHTEAHLVYASGASELFD